MARRIRELFGYQVEDKSEAAQAARAGQSCPFIGGLCSKEIGSAQNRIRSGVCSITDKDGVPIIICPTRLYADNYAMLSRVAQIAFKSEKVRLVDGRKASTSAVPASETLVAVFGKGWGGELKVPGRLTPGKRASGFFVDWILARLDSNKQLLEFAALEVQTMDTIGSYRAERDAILNGTATTSTSVGANWENVNKRILPQLIYKGHLLEREALCHSGLFFVCPEPVYQKIMDRLGNSLATYPLKNNSLTFIPMRMDGTGPHGIPLALNDLTAITTTVSQVQIAFSSATNLPEAGAYENAIRSALG